MIRAILLLIFLAFCSFIGYLIATSPNQIELVLSDKTISINLYEALFWAFIFSYLLQKALGFLYFIWRSPKIFSRNKTERKKQRAQSLLRRGLEEMIAGHYPAAEKLLVKGGEIAKSLEQSTVIFYENAAIAADKQLAFERRDNYLLEARKDSGKTQITLLNEAEIAINNGNYSEAENYLLKLLEREPRNNKIVLLLDEIYQKQNNWSEAWKNLNSRLDGNIRTEAFNEKIKSYLLNYLQELGQGEDFEALEKLYSQVPQTLKNDDEVVLVYANAAINLNKIDVAEKVLFEQINFSQNLQLIQAYSQLSRGDYKQQLNNILQWEKHHPDNAIFLLAKARIAFKAKDFALARNSVEQSLRLNISSEALILLAQILEASGDKNLALSAYSEAFNPSQSSEVMLLLEGNKSSEHEEN